MDVNIAIQLLGNIDNERSFTEKVELIEAIELKRMINNIKRYIKTIRPSLTLPTMLYDALNLLSSLMATGNENVLQAVDPHHKELEAWFCNMLDRSQNDYWYLYRYTLHSRQPASAKVIEQLNNAFCNHNRREKILGKLFAFSDETLAKFNTSDIVNYLGFSCQMLKKKVIEHLVKRDDFTMANSFSHESLVQTRSVTLKAFELLCQKNDFKSVTTMVEHVNSTTVFEWMKYEKISTKMLWHLYNTIKEKNKTALDRRTLDKLMEVAVITQITHPTEEIKIELSLIVLDLYSLILHEYTV